MQNHSVAVTRNGIVIDGQLIYLLAGQLHYFRYPQAEWRNLLQTAKAGGINTIDTVIAWNRHEPRAGEYDFAGEADLAAFLDLCHELALYAIVRPGPYICAEWENGGFPAWLTGKEGVELRVDNPIYMEHTARWFDRLFPLLVERQITRGGPIILCQIENEHWASGRYGHDDHQRTLARMATERGMELPQYTCMGAMDEWAEFRNGWSGIAEKLVQTRVVWPDNVMIVSELWSGWFDNWGASRHNHKTVAKLDVTLHQLLAVGASGWSHWMWAGGTNFAEWGGRTVGGDTIHMTTSYDYDAPVSEYGGLTEKYYVARRHHLFCSTLGAPMSAVLADAVAGGPRVIAPAAVAGRGEAGSAPYRNVRAASNAPAAWRDFTATFLQNGGLEGQTHQLFLVDGTHLAVEVEAASVKPVFTNVPLGTIRGQGSGVRGQGVYRLVHHTSRVLGFWEHQDGDTLVLYGIAGEAGELRIEQAEWRKDTAISSGANADFSMLNAQCSIRYTITERPTVVRVQAGERTLSVVLLTTERAARWWSVADGFLCGPNLVLPTQTGYAASKQGVQPFYRVGFDGRVERLPSSLPYLFVPLPLRLDNWTQHDAVERTATEGWRGIAQPAAFEALDYDGGYGWYRAEVILSQAQHTTIAAPWVNDRARLLVDGVDHGWLGIHPHGPRYTLPLDLAAGPHDIRLLVDNLGRFNYGSNTGERKGLLDTLYWNGQQHDITDGWVALWQEAVFAGEALANAKPAFVRADATNVPLAGFAFQGASVWLLREFEASENMSYLIHITGDRNPGALFVNGANVVRFSRHNGGGYIKTDISAHVRSGINVLALNITNYAGAAWRATLLEFDQAQALDAMWSFHPAVRSQKSGVRSQLQEPPNTQHPTPNTQYPTLGFWRATFAYDPTEHGAGPFKLALGGLRKGRIWLNGRGVGRYWQIGPQEYYKLPQSWMQAENELLIFEEEGGTPEGAEIITDALGAATLLD